MRVIVYKQRQRRISGYTTGELTVRLETVDPRLGETKHFRGDKPAQTVRRISRWLQAQAREPHFKGGGEIRVSTEVRGEHGGHRRINLVTAAFPKDRERVLDYLRATWISLPHEASAHEAQEAWLDQGE